MSDAETKKRRPVKRWIVLALILAGIYAAFIGPSYLKPVPPVVVLPGEPVGINIAGFEVTNTVIATLLADIVLILMGLGAWRFARSGKLIPEGFYNAFEAIVEFLWNTVTGSAEKKWAMRMFPLVATIFLLIFTANMVKLVPGFESIGLLHESPHGEGFEPHKLFAIGGLDVYTIDGGKEVIKDYHALEDAHYEEDSHGEDDHADEADAGHAAADDGHHELCEACEVVPFLRGSATDLNFTLALAVITVIMVQVYGVWALGPGYFSKYFPIQEVKTKGAMGAVSLFVGILEIVLEFAKILSFAFRLFGNIFAGALLLSIVGSLLPVIIPPGLYAFEVFFGIIQAYVFFLLAVVFVSGALVSHHGDHAEEHH